MILINLCRDPRVEHVAREQQDMLATLAAFGLPLSLVFSGAAVSQLNTSKGDEDLLSMLPSFGVSDIYVDAVSLLEANLDIASARIPCRAISDDALKALCKLAQHAVNI